VRKAGEALRVTAQLIRADTDEHLWSERFGGALTDVFDVPEEERRLATRPMDDLRAYESYLEAREASLEWSREALEHALEHLERARARVGENAVVLAGMGYVYSQFSNMALYDRDYLALVEEHARRALALDPDNPEAHMVLGFPYQEGLQDVDLSVHHLERSLQVEPDDPHTLTWWIIALSAVGRNDEMRAAAERLVEVDPRTPMSRGMLGYALQIQGDLVGGLEETAAWHRNSPAGSLASMFYAHALATVGRHEEARTILREEFASDTEEIWSFLARLLRAALEKDSEGMDAVMTEQFRTKAARDLRRDGAALSVLTPGKANRPDSAVRIIARPQPAIDENDALRFLHHPCSLWLMSTPALPPARGEARLPADRQPRPLARREVDGPGRLEGQAFEQGILLFQARGGGGLPSLGDRWPPRRGRELR